MKAISLLIACGLPLLLGSCLFTDPVFTEGFAKTDDSLTGVWVMEEEMADMTKADLAACFRVDETHHVLHYPAREKNGVYYSMQPLKVRDRDLLQLHVLGTLTDRPVRPGDKEAYTLLWIEKVAAGRINVHPPHGSKIEKTPVSEVRKMLADPRGDWNAIFGEPKAFKRISKE